MGNQIAPTTTASSKGRTESRKSDEEQLKGEELRQSAEASSKKSIDNPENKYVPRMFDVWAFGVNTVIGGQFYGWNEGLSAGFGGYAIGQVLTGFAYVNLSMSLAEICSTISFSGGAYGMTRVVLGFYVGFLVAAFELMEYITYTSAAAAFISNFLCEELGWDSNYNPLICLMFYAFMIALVLESNHVFWRVNAITSIVLLLIVAIYFFGSLQYTNFDRYARLSGDDDTATESGDRRYWFAGGMPAFLTAMPLMTWGFGGIEATALVTDVIHNPRVNVSYGMTAAVITLFVVMMALMFVACALPPGLPDFVEMPYYMDSGFTLMGLTTSAAHWLILPGQVAMGGGFFLPAAKLYHAISESHLVPKFMQVHHTNKIQQDDPANGTSVRETVTHQHHQRAVIYISIASYLLCLVDFYAPDFKMDSIPILLAQFTYLSDLYAYYKLKQVFNMSQDSNNAFVNPFGITGGVISGILFTLTAIGVIVYSGNNYTEIFFVAAFAGILSIYYFAYAKHYQVFSEEEQKKLLSLHVITNNQRKKRAQKKSNKFGYFSMLSYFSASKRQSSTSKKVRNSFGSVRSQSQHQQVSSHHDVSEGPNVI